MSTANGVDATPEALEEVARLVAVNQWLMTGDHVQMSASDGTGSGARAGRS